ncbi:hypothetical protein HU200_008067 [Digitaria exilis]|uniref:Uncharacterized protein n=1 Tax=Digitaria exilis TaxID=1010633 RepID=A0A835KTY7_9POAL|nr:hypothetical protein HU200_008067 [Digitaria exilis]
MLIHGDQPRTTSRVPPATSHATSASSVSSTYNIPPRGWPLH